MSGTNGSDETGADRDSQRKTTQTSSGKATRLASGTGIELAAAVGGGCLVGYWIDWHFRTSPWGLLAGAIIGIVGGIYNLVRPALREMARSDVNFGAHTVTHPRLTSLDPESAGREMAESRDQIEQMLGSPVLSIAYPYSQVDPLIKALASRCGYQLGCTYQPGYVGSAGQDALVLERIAILADDTLDDFRQKLRGDLRRRAAWYGRLGRDWLRRFLQARKGAA